MANRRLIGCLFMMTLSACSGEKRQNFTTLDDDGNIVISESSLAILHEIENDYYRTVEHLASDEIPERFTAEAICRFYEIDDFKSDDGYMSYKHIKDFVTINSGKWKMIGVASSQENLDEAQRAANENRAALAFDPLKSNHVAIILPGQQQKSSSWNLQAPNSASFFAHKGECYVSKALSYSFKSPEGIILYVRK